MPFTRRSDVPTPLTGDCPAALDVIALEKKHLPPNGWEWMRSNLINARNRVCCNLAKAHVPNSALPLSSGNPPGHLQNQQVLALTLKISFGLLHLRIHRRSRQVLSSPPRASADVRRQLTDCRPTCNPWGLSTSSDYDTRNPRGSAVSYQPLKPGLTSQLQRSIRARPEAHFKLGQSVLVLFRPASVLGIPTSRGRIERQKALRGS